MREPSAAIIADIGEQNNMPTSISMPDAVLSARYTWMRRLRQHTSAYVSIRQHTSAYVSIRQMSWVYTDMAA